MSNYEVIVDSNLSHAWARAFLWVMEPGQVSGSVLLLSVLNLQNREPEQDLIIRSALDEMLYATNKTSVDASAYTIFPYNMWHIRIPAPDRKWLFERYLHNLPRIRARNRLNNNGTYFERMITFVGSSDPRSGAPMVTSINQLEYVIQMWLRADKRGTSPRASALQVSCIDPIKDHTFQPRRGFPCLQQVSFNCDRSNRLLTVNSYYPTQYIYDRGYGNYLGLCHLGLFMAHEMGLILNRINCVIVHAELGGITKGQLRELEKKCRIALAASQTIQ
jgi:hypothetical protein